MNNAIVILNYNDYINTIDLVNQIKEYNSIKHIVIVDNCSTNESFSKLQKLKSSKIEVIKSKKNGGYAYGNNFGIKYCINKFNVDFVIIANPDVRFKEETIKEIEKFINKSSNNIGIVAPIIDDKINNYWKLPKFTNLLACPFLLTNKKYGNRKYKLTDQNLLKVDVISGAFFAITKNAFLNVNGFDEETFLYFEENILAFKLKEKKYNNFIINTINYEHKLSTSIDTTYKSKIKPFKIYAKSVKLYSKKYLKNNILEQIVLHIFFYLGYIERLIYEILIRIIKDRKNE